VFSYAELRKATRNFDDRNLLGRGGSGSVYKGSFETPGGSRFVAVKQIRFSEPKQAESLFHAEVVSLGQIRHRNVVQLLGWCQEKGRLMLVYDFMPNGALSEWIHTSGSEGFALSLKMRHSILEEVGAAMEYLHEDCLSCVLHRDIKSSNVLLDADFKAHLGDFGLARLMDHHKVDKTTLAAGTFGYMAPEMPYTGKATKESDVYSFGILVLEVVSGRRPLDMQATEPEDLVLLHMVWRAHEDGSLLNVVDPKLIQTLQPLRFVSHLEDDVKHAPSPINCNKGSDNNVLDTTMVVDFDAQVYATMVVDLLRLGLFCCLPNPKARPSMGQVNRILQQIRDMVNVSSISSVVMPFLPATKPLGLFHSLEFSQTSLSLSSSSPPISKAHTKLIVQNSTAFDIFSSSNRDE